MEPTRPMTEDELRSFKCIKRIDPCASYIIDSSTHVALYHFNNTSKKWERSEIDGPLFVYRRIDRPFHSLMIANRHSRDEYIEPITSKVQVDQHFPYLFFRNADNVISGLWFYKESDCNHMHETLKKLITISSAGPSPTPMAKAPTAPPALMGAAYAHPPPPAYSHPPPAYTHPPPPLPVHHTQPPPPIREPPKEPEPKECPIPLAFQKLKINAPTPPAHPQISVPQSPAVSTPGPIMKLLPENKSMNSLANFSTASVFGSESEARLDDQSDGRRSQNSNAVAAAALLSKEQMLLAVQHLLETDEEFVLKLHTAYANAINKRLVGRSIGSSEG